MSREAFRIIVLASAALALQACASVKVPMPSLGGGPEASVPIQEHTALRQATDRLEAVVPVAARDARKGGLHTVVFGGRGDAERAAASAYLAGLPAPNRLGAVFAEAGHVLAAGREVAEAGMIGPTDAASETDLALLEGAITELQQARRLLTTSLKLLREDGAPVTKSEIRELGDAFVATARDIGAAADLAAARADDAAPRYADGPAGGAPSY